MRFGLPYQKKIGDLDQDNSCSMYKGGVWWGVVTTYKSLCYEHLNIIRGRYKADW